ncbi:MAG TPA: DUF502 domain-containing protein [Rhabdochlamydiaceae bacterium]|jgi:uncharacterized membrane protein|nr:DUF502 domain-containing protein [Rhabdochlamydiaceae bacterium]
MKKSFSTGLIILLPFALTVWVVHYLFDLFTNPLFNILEKTLLWFEQKQGLSLLHHETLVTFLSRMTALVLTFFFIVALGFLARKFFFKGLLKFTHEVMIRIPVVGTIYRLTKDLTKAMLSTDQKTFKETVLVPFPSPETYSVGFITADVPAALKKVIPQTDVTVFVPTAPHPISGYVLFCARKATHSVDISVEDTFKFLLSCGVIQPPPKP